MLVSQNRGPQYRPSYTIVLIVGTPKMVTLIVGNLHIGEYYRGHDEMMREVLKDDIRAL